MEAKELSIGNVVYVDNNKHHPQLKNLAVKITDIRKYNTSGGTPRFEYGVGVEVMDNKVYPLDYHQLMKFIKPIKITKNWLKKLGFEYNGSTWQGDFDEGFSEWKLTSYGFIDYDENLLWHNNKYYKYVHELQNLVFAITTTELEIKQDVSACG